MRLRPSTSRLSWLRAFAASTLVAVSVVVSACGGESGGKSAPDGSTKRAVPTSKPSLVIVDVSGVRYDAVFPPEGKTSLFPAFAKFAAAHTRFEQASAAAAWEIPSVAAILTGLLPRDSGVEGIYGKDRPYLIPPIETIAEALKAEGYVTAAFVGGAPVGSSTALDQGFGNAWHEGWRIEDGAAAVSTWLEKKQAGAPFFLFVQADSTLPAMPAGTADPAAWARSTYATRAATVDAGLAALLAALTAAKLPADTVTMLVSDHGESLFERPETRLVSRGGGLFDEQVRVPLVIDSPAFPASTKVLASCSLTDLWPTMRDLMGLPPRAGVDGRSLLPLGKSPDAAGLPAFSQEWRVTSGNNGPLSETLYSVRTAKGKYVAAFSTRPPSWTETAFDLEKDPLESSPLPLVPASTGAGAKVPQADVARFGPEFVEAVSRLRDVLQGRRNHLNDEIVAPYVAGGG